VVITSGLWPSAGFIETLKRARAQRPTTMDYIRRSVPLKLSDPLTSRSVPSPVRLGSRSVCASGPSRDACISVPPSTHSRVYTVYRTGNIKVRRAAAGTKRRSSSTDKRRLLVGGVRAMRCLFMAISIMVLGPMWSVCVCRYGVMFDSPLIMAISMVPGPLCGVCAYAGMGSHVRESLSMCTPPMCMLRAQCTCACALAAS
jgi:hypothetical protein